MILSGEKAEEYREQKDYWLARLFDFHKGRLSGCDFYDENGWGGYTVKHFDAVKFTNGYSKNARTFTIELLGISFGTGFAEWGAAQGQEYFILNLGKIIK